MSFEAADWARHRAPMLRTDAGRPDTTSRAVLTELAEHADKHGANSFPSVLHMQWALGFDERTIDRALKRLQAGLLISPTGMTREGCIKWQLHMGKERPETDWESLLKEVEKKAEKNAGYQARHRERVKGVDASGMESSLRIDAHHTEVDRVRDGESLSKGRRVSYVRDSPSKRKGRSAPLTVSEPPEEPPDLTLTGGAPPPDPRRPEEPSAPRTEQPNSLTTEEAQPPRADTFTHDRTREAKPNTDGFHMPKGCGYRDCISGFVVPADSTPPFQCPSCNSNVVELRRPA